MACRPSGQGQALPLHMESILLKESIGRISAADEPRVEMVPQAQQPGLRLGVLAASFNPVTNAHVELIRRAAEAFSLDETLALAGVTNADKTAYDCPLEDRLAMLQLAFAGDSRVLIGLSSHAFYVDMLEALERVCAPGTDLHFVVGFDTFERVLDRDDRYTKRYHRSFTNRSEALRHLLSRSRLIVASRAGSGPDQGRALIGHVPPEITGRILFLDFPSDLGKRSATEVRARLAEGLSIAGLVPEGVERYISEQGLYRPAI
ncbi:MAG: nicotinate-nicotinamide nucleotide adenylyltransferase [Acidobacteriota bacterium]